MWGSPTIQADLSTFDAQFGYPDPPSFKIIAPAGAIPTWDPNNSTMTGWAGETTLDVEYAHTIAPGANILLVETPTAETEGVTGFPEIVKAEEYVVNHHLGDLISQSFSATEQTFTSYAQQAPLRAAYLDAFAHGVTVLAATGDDGVANPELDGSTLYTTPTTGCGTGWAALAVIPGCLLQRPRRGTDRRRGPLCVHRQRASPW
ncbi:hypothetical protein EAS64_03060 [Trebonia kvetii]|uniref:Peptidase S53 domain-containing protein n=1 Tax=Trebonia kvetii TaxID=2480626 RepID=A0A6P2C7V8_9ACTN|nr:hypothetical protein [Trebonia kvetii]TVZ06416.1 hypothetical protein EAS64_03060 [Trebonia kvetii]